MKENNKKSAKFAIIRTIDNNNKKVINRGKLQFMMFSEIESRHFTATKNGINS